MTNSESLGAESATEPTTKPEQDALNMSAGAEMLIARMKTNPEDFRYNGRFYRAIEASSLTAPHQGWISARDAIAIRTAYETIIQEADFTEWVYGEIFNPKEPEPASPQMYQSRYAQQLGQSMTNTKNLVAGQILQGGFSDTRALYNNPLQGQLSSVGQGTMLQQIKTKIGL